MRYLAGLSLSNSVHIYQFTPKPSISYKLCCRCVLSVTQTNQHDWVLVLAFMRTHVTSPDTQSSMVFTMDFCANMLEMCVLSMAQNFVYCG